MKRGYMICPKCHGKRKVKVGNTDAQCNFCGNKGEVKKKYVKEYIFRELEKLSEFVRNTAYFAQESERIDSDAFFDIHCYLHMLNRDVEQGLYSAKRMLKLK